MKYLLPLLLSTLFFCSHSFAQEAERTPADVVSGAVQAAEALMEVLSEEQRAALMFEFGNDEQRKNWSNLPEGRVRRGGIRWGDLSDQQKDAVMALLGATLSEEGVQQIIDNMDGDEVLGRPQGGRRGNPNFGRDIYFLSILGTPSTTEPWMWQFGGHHLGVNATFSGENLTLSPSLTGGQPIDFTIDGREVRQLAHEEDAAYRLIGSLTDEQLSDAVVEDGPNDLLTGPGWSGGKPVPAGINAGKLDDEQKQLLMSLIGTRIAIINEVHAAQRMEEIEAELDEHWFAWFGSTEPGGVAGFRIQGPTILMEYAPQRLGGDWTQHIHAMYRDPANDYGTADVAALESGAAQQAESESGNDRRAGGDDGR
ncbi:MAG: DUF3500 domain-containing protein [Planctomycetota bacterium]